jgi:hypothetical protein
MKSHTFLTSAALSLVAFAPASFALAGSAGDVEPVAIMEMAPESTSFGFLGLAAIYGFAENPTDGDEFSSFSPVLEGAYAFTLGNGAAIVVDGMLRTDGYDSDITDSEVSLMNYQASVHYLHGLGNNMRVGGFAGYGVAPFEDDNEVYQVGFAGITALHNTSANLALFGQLAYGTSFDPDVMSSAGFYNGGVVRAGVIYSGLNFATIRAEAEYAFTEQYEDPDEPGEMWTIALTGESAIAAVDNLYVSYGVRYASFDALVDSDIIFETSASVEVKYMFGGGTPERFAEIGYVGSPYLLLRGSFWTPAMD